MVYALTITAENIFEQLKNNGRISEAAKRSWGKLYVVLYRGFILITALCISSGLSLILDLIDISDEGHEPLFKEDSWNTYHKYQTRRNFCFSLIDIRSILIYKILSYLLASLQDHGLLFFITDTKNELIHLD